MTTNTAPTPRSFDADAHRRRIATLIGKKSFCTLATVSPAGHPHSAGVVYEVQDGAMWIHLDAGSRKGRNIAADPRVGVTIPFRRIPVGPPYTIHFQATAELVPMDDPEAVRLLEAGKLSSIAGHGALDMPDGTFVKVTPRRTVHSFGPGVRIVDIIRDPLRAGARMVRFDGEVLS